MDSQEITIKTYDESAEKLAEYFAGIGSRIVDIEKGIELTRQAPSTIDAIEIGCGDGRDAVEIVNRVSWYEGFDPSEGLLKIAQERPPEASFKQADALTYNYLKEVDLYFAFASLLHVNRWDLAKVFEHTAASLRTDGIFYISLKERPEYQEELQEDQYGKRMFYYYNPKLIESIAGNAFSTVYEDHQTIGKTNWFTIALKKK